MQSAPLPVAPNVRAFQDEREQLALGLLHLQAAALSAIASGVLSFAIGIAALSEGFGTNVVAIRDPLFYVMLGSGGLQFVVLLIGYDGILKLAPRSRGFFPAEDAATAGASVWFLLAFVAIFVGGAIGAVFAGPALFARFSGGPSFGQLTITQGLILSALSWGLGGLVFNLFVARGLQMILAPYVEAATARRWEPIYLTVAASSALAVALSVWGLLALNGSNPAGLAGAVSAFSLYLLLRIVGEARKRLRERPGPAPLWPPVVSVPVVVPMAPASQGGPVSIAVVPAFVQGPAFTYPAAPPAQCPRCQSAQLSYAQLPARGFLCGQCGLGAPY